MSHSTVDFSSYILSAAAVRERAQLVFNRIKAGETEYIYHPDRLDFAAGLVVDLYKKRFPKGDVPYHSRWRHFSADGFELINLYISKLEGLDDLTVAKRGVDLVVASVLVDAGAGPSWSFRSKTSDAKIGRSEGLGLASLEFFLSGGLSRDGSCLEVHGDRLLNITESEFEEAFQVDDDNPLLGVSGRVGLLRALGGVLCENKHVFPNCRPSDLVDYFKQEYGNSVPAQEILGAILRYFGDIWPGRLNVDGANLGDTWIYMPIGTGEDAYVPFHKLSQWLAYSIVETLEMGGFAVTGLEVLTGLAEYRNGGLLIDSGILELRNSEISKEEHLPSSELIIEWRSATIVLIDEIAARVRQKLGVTEVELPLAKILEAGTWLAGRALAGELRADKSPPLKLSSDGTVF